ncbi:MAG: molybdopterin-dependent oxidoreductase [Candidatus Moduliflexus flocculans]|nr:molybdopterin-dependent oxidoreductase [Candidatus Moduliflexus flocculans]
MTGGFICGKVRRFGQRLYGPDRLLRPGVRLGPPGSGEFRWVSWDEALARVADAMRDARDRWGAESVLPYCYGGSNGLLTQDTTDAGCSGASARRGWRARLCASTTGAANQALYGKMPSVTLRRLRPREAHRRLGRESVGVGHPPGAVHPRGAAGRGLARRRGPAGDPAGPPGRSASRDQARHGRRGRPRAAPPSVRERACRRGVPRGAHDRRRGVAGTRARVDLRARGRGGRPGARRHRPAGRHVRRGVAGGHPLRVGAGAEPERRQCRGRDPRAAGRRGEVRRARRRVYAQQLRVLGHHRSP